LPAPAVFVPRTNRGYNDTVKSFTRSMLVMSLAACGVEPRDASQTLAVPVDVALARGEEVSREVSTVASLDSEFDVLVSAEVSGRVQLAGVDEGASVAEGTSLLSIDARQYELALERARAVLEQVRAQFENDSLRLARTRDLLAAGAVDPQTVDDLHARAAQSRALVTAQRASVEAAEHDHRRAAVPAPFAGTFMDRRVDSGDYVRPGDPLGRLANLGTLRLTFWLPEADASSVLAGEEVRFTVNALGPDRAFAGSIYYVSPAVDPGTRTVAVKARVANPERILRPGMSAEVRVATSTPEWVVVVPEVAVRTEGGSSYLFRVSGGSAARVPVETGVRPVPGRIVVAGDVEPGDSVVTAGFQKLADAMPVVVRIVTAAAEQDGLSPR
jgi:membrane fusion protein (multidrug efflux system)